MTQELCIGQTGVIAPFNCKEGTITITDSATAHGTIKAPVLSAGLKKGDSVTLAGEMLVVAASGTDFVVGTVYNNPKWDVEPRTDRTQAQAVSAGELREAAIETVFKKIETVTAKASEGITAGKFLVNKAGTFELSASSGSTASDYYALSDQNSTTNRVVVGYL